MYLLFSKNEPLFAFLYTRSAQAFYRELDILSGPSQLLRGSIDTELEATASGSVFVKFTFRDKAV